MIMQHVLENLFSDAMMVDYLLTIMLPNVNSILRKGWKGERWLNQLTLNTMLPIVPDATMSSPEMKTEYLHLNEKIDCISGLYVMTVLLKRVGCGGLKVYPSTR